MKTVPTIAVCTERLTKKYGNTTAVDGLNLSIHSGELFALLGVNGAGKTTTVKMLSCLTQPTAGDALLYGRSVRKDAQAVKSLIAVSPQETAIAPNLTVQENLELMAGIYGFSGAKLLEKIQEMTEMFGLQEVMRKKAKVLSGGWQRRLSIAMALISEPKILFLDEPTLGMDVLARCDLWDAVRALKGKVTMILTTHYMEEAEALADRLGVMKDGRLLFVGTAKEAMEQTEAKTFEEAFVALVKGDGK